GVLCRVRTICRPSGSTSCFTSSLQPVPEEKLTVIVLCNSGDQNVATTLAHGIAALCFGGTAHEGRTARTAVQHVPNLSLNFSSKSLAAASVGVSAKVVEPLPDISATTAP